MTPANKNLPAAVADLLEIGIWLVDGRGRTIYRNASMATMAPGVESFAELGACIPQLSIVDCLNQLHAGNPVIIAPGVLLKVDGRERFVRLRLARVPSLKGHPERGQPDPDQGSSCFLLTMELLREVVETQAICHEVNNPLAILSGEIELLRREQGALATRVSTMQGAVGRITDVVVRLRRSAEELRHAPKGSKRTRGKAA
jgi:hypothetical protein